MKHYVVYHNVEGMGFSFRDRDDDEESGSFSIFTRRNAGKVRGNIIWVISGEGKPREYLLEYWFIAEEVEENGDGSRSVLGREGVSFPGGIPLNRLPWFKNFFVSQNNFSFGMQVIRDEYVPQLEAAARSAGRRTPGEEYVSRTAPSDIPDLPPGTAEPALRQAIVVNRIIRDTAVTNCVKLLHGYKCQVCGLNLAMPDGLYAEGSHIRPLGSPHDGPDAPGNVLCLCPNHHVLLDFGAFSIKDNLTLIGMDGKLRTEQTHQIDPANLRYHRKLFGWDKRRGKR